MTKTLTTTLTTLTGWTANGLLHTLPLIAFIVGFALLDDVLVAALAAFAVALAQLVLNLSARGRVDVMSLASLAIVIALLGLTLYGDHAGAAALASPVSGDVTHCICRMPLTYL